MQDSGPCKIAPVITIHSEHLHKHAPGNTYRLARGFQLEVHAGEAVLTGGPETLRIAARGNDYVGAVAIAQARCAADLLVCTHSEVALEIKARLPEGMGSVTFPGSGVLFRTPKGYISEEALGEFLIERIDFTRYSSRHSCSAAAIGPSIKRPGMQKRTSKT